MSAKMPHDVFTDNFGFHIYIVLTKREKWCKMRQRGNFQVQRRIGIMRETVPSVEEIRELKETIKKMSYQELAASGILKDSKK